MNRAITVANAALAAFQCSTGLSGTVVQPQETDAGRGVDAWIKIKTDRGEVRFAAQVKVVDRFQTPAQVKAALEGGAARPLLVAPYISREAAEHCRGLSLSFIDAAGNAYLKAPGLFVYVTGQGRPGAVHESRFRALGTAGLRVSFALLSRPELLGATYREIGSAAGAAPGSITHVFRDLEARGLLLPADRRVILDPRRLLDEWVTHYPIGLRPKLHPRRFEMPREIGEGAELGSLGACWGGEPAAQELTKVFRAELFTIYTHRPVDRLVGALRLRANPTGNLEVLDAFWNFKEPAHPGIAPPMLVYADLMATRNGRNIEAAKLIYEQHIEPAFRAFQTGH